jgi:hypothetical protein
MNVEAMQQVADILTINILFHAALYGSIGLYLAMRAHRFVQSLPAPREIA